MQVKPAKLFNVGPKGVELYSLNSELNKLIQLKTKNPQLKYDVNIKLGKAVQKAIADFQETHKKAIEAVGIKEGETVPNEKNDEILALINAALNDPIEFNCYPIKYSRLAGEDISDLNLLALEDFIEFDISEN